MVRVIRVAGALLMVLALIVTAMPMAAGASPLREQKLAPAMSQGGEATVRFTFLGCADGVDPRDSPDQCTTRLAAPESAYIATAPDYVERVHTMPRDDDGAYVFESGFVGQPIGLHAFYPPDYNYFMFDGADENEKWYSSLTLEPGERREVTIYYWNGPEGLIQPGTNTVHVTVLGCAEGTDPNKDASSCTEPIDAPETLYVEVGDDRFGHVGPLNDVPRDGSGTYTFDGLAPYTKFSLYTMIDPPESDPVQYLFTGDAESITAGKAQVYALRGETRELTVYVYNRDGGSDEEDTGTIRINVLGCPEGVDPNIDATACDIPLDIPGTARVVHRHDLLNVLVAEQPRAEDGAYIIDGVIPEGYPIVGLDHEGYGSFLVEGLTESSLVGNVIEVRAGMTTDIVIYYYDPA